MSTKKKFFRYSFLVVFLLIIASFFTYFWTNIFFLGIEKNYFIPKQSSIFAFNATIFNGGSSDIWEYGEDSKNYYYNLMSLDNKVVVYPRTNFKQCQGFDAKNINTWCNIDLPK